MTEKQAIREGLQSTGIYVHSKYDTKRYNRVKLEAAAIRSRGFRAVIVSFAGDGFGVYAETRFFQMKTLDSQRAKLKTFEARKADLKASYENDLETLALEEKETNEAIKRLESELQQQPIQLQGTMIDCGETEY